MTNDTTSPRPMVNMKHVMAITVAIPITDNDDANLEIGKAVRAMLAVKLEIKSSRIGNRGGFETFVLVAENPYLEEIGFTQ